MAPPPSRGFFFEIPALTANIYVYHQGLAAEVAKTVSFKPQKCTVLEDAEANVKARAGLTFTDTLLPAAS